MSCAIGTRVRTGRKTFELVENLFEGAELVNPADPSYHSFVTVNQPLRRSLEPCVRVKMEHGDELICTPDHCFLADGVTFAGESEGSQVQTAEGSTRVVEVSVVGSHVVISLILTAPHIYETNGFFSLGEDRWHQH